MLNIEVSNREITSPGLYVMRWKKHTGFARVVGGMRLGFKIINSKETPESYVPGLPADGTIPPDALFSEPISVVPV